MLRPSLNGAAECRLEEERKDHGTTRPRVSAPLVRTLHGDHASQLDIHNHHGEHKNIHKNRSSDAVFVHDCFENETEMCLALLEHVSALRAAEVTAGNTWNGWKSEQ